jgi:ankyrin repeat protein
MDQLLDRVTDLLKLVNNNSSRFPQMLEVTLFERDRSGMTALHHAVRSGSRLTVRWCMNNGAIACPSVNLGTSWFPKPKPNQVQFNVNLRSFIAEGWSSLTQATLWECVVIFTLQI